MLQTGFLLYHQKVSHKRCLRLYESLIVLTIPLGFITFKAEMFFRLHFCSLVIYIYINICVPSTGSGEVNIKVSDNNATSLTAIDQSYMRYYLLEVLLPHSVVSHY